MNVSSFSNKFFYLIFLTNVIKVTFSISCFYFIDQPYLFFEIIFEQLFLNNFCDNSPFHILIVLLFSFSFVPIKVLGLI